MIVCGRPSPGSTFCELSPGAPRSDMAELHHECGIVAIYHLPGRGVSPLLPVPDPNQASRLIPRMLLDVQNRGQLAAGMTTFDTNPNRPIDPHKDVCTVTEVFH